MTTLHNIRQKDFDSETWPQRVCRSHLLAELKAQDAPVVSKWIKIIDGKHKRLFYKVLYKGKAAFVDCVTAQLYQDGKCLSSDSITMMGVKQR